MGKNRKYPDNVVYDYENDKFISHLLPYPTNLSSPVITQEITDISKQESISKINTLFDVKFKEIIDEYRKLYHQYEINKLVLSSKYSFTPKVGDIYHLYDSNKNGVILSIIKPSEWDLPHIMSVRLNSDNVWELSQY